MISLDEAISYAEEVAEKCEIEHCQLAEWLQELKWWRSQLHRCYTCKYLTLSIFDEPCINCDDKQRKKWECGYERGEEN